MSVNWVDLIFAIILLYFILANSGFVRTLLELGGFVIALFMSYQLYAPLGTFISSFLTVPRGFSFVIAFFLIWFIAELLFFIFAYYFLKDLMAHVQKKPYDIVLGYFLGAIQGCLIFLFFISLVFGLPVRGEIKQLVLTSATGPIFVNLSQSFETNVKEVFGEAATETLNFLTVEPQSGEVVSLGFKVPASQLSFDQSSEAIMLEKVNAERTSRGLPALVEDPRLRSVARAYGQSMLENGFFAHVSPVDGSDVSIRATREGIPYSIIGENLAFAPDVYIAHQGLMNSPGHRANILDTEFKKVGIGVIDAGPYGKMFVQNFSD